MRMSYSIYSLILDHSKEGVPHANKYSKITIHLKKRTNKTKMTCLSKLRMDL